MVFFVPFFLGFIIAAIGLLIPGLINMTAAKIGSKEGRSQGQIFVFGAVLVIMIQTFVAAVFARYLDQNPLIIKVLRTIGLLVFFLLFIYFFIQARKPVWRKEKIRIKSKKSRFFLGMMLSGINFFSIPYYVFASVTLASYGLFEFTNFFMFFFVAGTGMGSYAMFYSYILFFKKKALENSFIMKNMNAIICTVTGLACLLTLFNIMKFYL